LLAVVAVIGKQNGEEYEGGSKEDPENDSHLHSCLVLSMVRCWGACRRRSCARGGLQGR
jgi:hypothetical protein